MLQRGLRVHDGLARAADGEKSGDGDGFFVHGNFQE
jgi:hypothetical protein